MAAAYLAQYHWTESTRLLRPREPVPWSDSEEGDERGCEGMAAQTCSELGRHGRLAKHVPLGGNGTLIPVTCVIGTTVT